MNKYREQIEKIENDIYYGMGKYSQKVIDFIEETLERIDIERICDDTLGSIEYDLSILLEIWNPELKEDINILYRIDSVLIDWRGYLKS